MMLRVTNPNQTAPKGSSNSWSLFPLNPCEAQAVISGCILVYVVSIGSLHMMDGDTAGRAGGHYLAIFFHALPTIQRSSNPLKTFVLQKQQ